MQYQSKFKPKMYYPKSSKKVPATTVPAYVAIALASLLMAAVAIGIIAAGLSMYDRVKCERSSDLAYVQLGCDRDYGVRQ